MSSLFINFKKRFSKCIHPKRWIWNSTLRSNSVNICHRIFYMSFYTQFNHCTLPSKLFRKTFETQISTFNNNKSEKETSSVTWLHEKTLLYGWKNIFLKIVSFKTTISQKKCAALSILHQKSLFLSNNKISSFTRGT